MTIGAGALAMILVVGAVTNALRLSPFLLASRLTLRTEGSLARFLELVAFAIIGSLIAGAVVKAPALTDPLGTAGREAAIRLLTVTATFGLAVRVRRLVPCLAAGLGLFSLLRLLLG